LDDCLKEEKRVFNSEGKKVGLSKPNPYMLDAIKERSGHAASKCYYVGDMPDDMIAASRSKAGFIGIGFTKSAADKNSRKEALLQAGANYIIEDIEKLLKIVGEKQGP
ncbi:MAG: HAD hydrolase-like protein, partial [Desulfobacterales bacterium]